MAKQIVINNWQQGIGTSAFTGLEEIRNLNVDDKPGIATINYKLAKSSGTTITGKPLALVTNENDLYTVTDDHKLFKYSAAGGWAEIDGGSDTSYTNGVLYKDYIGIARSQQTDWYGPLSGTPGWTTILTLESSTHKPMIVAEDGHLYIGNGRYLSRIVEDTTFDPAVDTTFTFTAEALRLPVDWEIIKIAQLGDGLMIAANNQKTEQYSIFPWDTTSVKYDLPVKMGNQEIQTMITVNNLVYVIAGRNGSIYATDGTNVQFIRQFPDTIMELGASKKVVVNPNAIISMRDKIYIGTSATGLGTFAAVWTLNLNNKRLTIENLISTGNTDSPKIGALTAYSAVNSTTDKQLTVGWEDTTFGVDRESSTYRYTGYTAYAVSQWQQASLDFSPLTLTPEVHLASPLTTGEGVKLYYRTDQQGTWVQIGDTWTVNNALPTDKNQYKQFPDIPNIRSIQIKIELTTFSEGLGTPELYQVILRWK